MNQAFREGDAKTSECSLFYCVYKTYSSPCASRLALADLRLCGVHRGYIDAVRHSDEGVRPTGDAGGEEE